jgi:hypothetical protein
VTEDVAISQVLVLEEVKVEIEIRANLNNNNARPSL